MRLFLFIIPLIYLSLLISNQAHALNVTMLTGLSTVAADNKQSALLVTSPQQAVQIVKRRYKAKILRVQSANVNGATGYRIKLVTIDGQVFSVSVNARTGAVSRN